MFSSKITFDSFVRGLLVVAFAVAAIWVLSYLSGVLLPFVVAWFCAYLLYPIVCRVQRVMPFRLRALAVLVTVAGLLAIVIGAWSIVSPMVNEEMSGFKVALARFVSNKDGSDIGLAAAMSDFLRRASEWLEIDELLNGENLIAAFNELLPKAWLLVTKTFGFLFSLISVAMGVIYFFFIMIDYEKLCAAVRGALPRGKSKFYQSLLDDLDNGMSRYFRGQALISLCVGILFSIGLTIIDFPLAIPLGMLIGVLSLVPYLHSLGLIPIVLFSAVKAAEMGQSYWIVLASGLGVFLVVQMIQETVLTPHIMGATMSLPPFLILLSISVWGYVLGIMGMIIALPITTVALSYYRRYVLHEGEGKEEVTKG